MLIKKVRICCIAKIINYPSSEKIDLIDGNTSEEEFNEPFHNNAINFMQPDFKPAEIRLPINLFF